MNSATQYRTEKDPMGRILVPKTAYYGPQTQRAVENFQISGLRLPRSFIKAQGIIKASAATANMNLGMLERDIGQAIVQASEEVIEGKWDNHFVVDVYQAGAGTSQNMNANEVIANRASEILTGSLESYKVHANDHVNMAQSTNDTFPAAIHIAALENMEHRLLPAISNLQKELERKSEAFMPILKSGRTHLHDAVPIRLGQEFAGYAQTIESVYHQIEATLDPFYEIGLGGNAIGTIINTHPDYPQTVIAEIANRTNFPFRQPASMFSYMQNRNAPIRSILALKELAVHLIKITSDLRLLASGPRTGITEISLPNAQPGSTIMPGKVNPAILEMTHMVCCQIIGYEEAIATAGMASQLEINVMSPVIAHTLLESIEILSNAIPTLTTKCVSGIEANEVICKDWMESSLSVVTGLSPLFGYDLASDIGGAADDKDITIEQELEERGLLTEDVRNLIDPRGMV
ncbi:fumarate hydratase class II [Virgibacillus natechei]|uniref:Fumarate hydratase class II n=1 Tax=Virgibacillus natechei TaxID=1216297 RepID=A0ABS4IH23_9BACI|nr:class II fumarate hydratase [Virgibacillus natechei]MBP1970230.1 fumarate hydratase class II [Virgibacillus natechei]UZD12822.1 class II fumarate hydratase [Virgibacillus natechei]